MTNCKTILTFVGGGLLFLVIWVTSDAYSKYRDNICMNNEPQELTQGMR